MICGLILSAIAFAAVPLGLGEGSDFLLYRLVAISRKSAVYAGVLVMLASIFSHPRLLATLFPPAAIKEEFSARSSHFDTSRHMLVLTSQLALAIAVAFIAFIFNRHNVLGYIDGQYVLTLIKNQTEFMSGRFGFSTNPLQGLGDLWFFTNTRWLPELAVARLFSEPSWQRIAIQSMALIELFVVTAGLAYWLYRTATRAATAAWLTVLMLTPLTFPALILDVLGDAPELATLIALPLIIIATWAQLGRGAVWRDAASTLLIALLLWFHFIGIGLFAALAYPAIAVFALVFTLASWSNRAEFWRKIAFGGILVVSLFLSGLPQALLGIVLDSAFQLFPDRLMRSAHELSDGSILLRPREPVGVVLAAIGLVSIYYHMRYGSGDVRRFAIAALLFAGLLLSASVAYAFVGGSGARPIYYEYVFWPVYPILAAPLLAVAWSSLRRILPSMPLGRSAIFSSRGQWLTLPLVALLLLHGTNRLIGMQNGRPNVYPPQATTITDYLRREIGLAAGAPFRGRVVTMTGQHLPAAASWDQTFEMDIRLIRSIGSEHRSIGLWYFNVPTLIEFTHTIPPFLYAIAERYLARPDDSQVRNILTMRQPDVRILRMLGVRYIITDSVQPVAGVRRVAELPVTQQDTLLALDEISNPNVGTSPIAILPLGSAEQALEWIGQSDSDLEQTATLSGPDPGQLSLATDITIVLEQDGLRIRGKSAARSLVVVPFYFSHCLRTFTRNGRPSPELRRANLALTGILFEVELDVTVQYRQGPLDQPSCRLDDLADDRRLLQAR